LRHGVAHGEIGGRHGLEGGGGKVVRGVRVVLVGRHDGGVGERARGGAGEAGEDGPVIAILGEYDALPGLSQAAGVAEPQPLPGNGYGHGCGHNLLGSAAMLAATAVRDYLAASGLNGRVQFHEMQVYDLAQREETYDLVLFMGVFYHLRYPLRGLDIVARKVGRLLLFQSLSIPGAEVYEETYDHNIYDREPMREPGWPKMAFIEHRFGLSPLGARDAAANDLSAAFTLNP